MHEKAFAQALVDLIVEQAAVERFATVRRLVLEIGTMGHVEPHALVFCFEAVAHGTVAEGATLEIEDVPGQALCVGCETAVTIVKRGNACPVCGGLDLLVQGGDALRLKEMEVV